MSVDWVETRTKRGLETVHPIASFHGKCPHRSEVSAPRPSPSWGPRGSAEAPRTERSRSACSRPARRCAGRGLGPVKCGCCPRPSQAPGEPAGVSALLPSGSAPALGPCEQAVRAAPAGRVCSRQRAAAPHRAGRSAAAGF